MKLRLFPIAMIAILAGCTRYEFDVLDPPDLGRVSSDADTVYKTDAVEYRLRNASGYLVLHLYNYHDKSITLAAPQSTVIAPDGQSHPLLAQMIEPGSYIKLIFPPPAPDYYDDNPSFYFGAGYGYGYGYDYGHHHHHHHHSHHHKDRGDRYKRGYHHHNSGWRGYRPFYGPWYSDSPRYYRVYDTANPYYWDWYGEGQIRVKFVYDFDGRTLEDRLVVNRTKVKP